MSEFMTVAIGEDVIGKISAIPRSYREGISFERIMSNFGFANSSTVRAALQALVERGEVVQKGDVYQSSIYCHNAQG